MACEKRSLWPALNMGLQLLKSNEENKLPYRYQCIPSIIAFQNWENNSSEELFSEWAIGKCEQLRGSFLSSVWESIVCIWVLGSEVSLLKYCTQIIVSNTIIFFWSWGRRHNCRTMLNSCVLYFSIIFCVLDHVFRAQVVSKPKVRTWGIQHYKRIRDTTLFMYTTLLTDTEETVICI